MENKRHKQILCTLGMIAALSACGGAASTTSATTTTRMVSGNLAASASVSSGAFLASDSCAADTIIATDTSGTSTTATVADDCSFSITLEVDKSYAVAFVLNDAFVATLTFDTGASAYSTSEFHVTAGSSEIALGLVTFTGTIALPETNPLTYTDDDGDGVSDYDDSDDDGDSVSDNDEQDCDFDGVRDDYEDDTSDCHTSTDGTAAVLEVKPHDNLEDTVDLDKKVRARIDCVVDQTTVDNATFVVTSESDEVIECAFTFETEDGNNTKIECSHATAFSADTVYTATIDGVLCDDTTPVESISWSWLTSLDGTSSSSDSEDSLDDDSGSSNDSSDDSEDDSED